MFFKPKLKSYLFGRFSELKYSEFLTSFITVLGYSCPKSGDDDDADDDDNDDDVDDDGNHDDDDDDDDDADKGSYF